MIAVAREPSRAAAGSPVAWPNFRPWLVGDAIDERPGRDEQVHRHRAVADPRAGRRPAPLRLMDVGPA
ncbi:MAG: hypothetical protein QOC73_564, partial [Actinomycetota bacterium]|nr:hypothetical protein [Actinomycetota bacterium]